MRRRLVVGALVTAVVTASTPAVASDHYCGHTARVGITGKQAFVQSWTDRDGDHRHTVSVIRWWSGTPKYVWPHCKHGRR